jgi:hypothetical protein
MSGEESNLVRHARHELELLGEEPETVAGYLKVIQAFSDMDHSGGSAFVAIPTIYQLLKYKNLMPLTDNPDEWIHHDEDVWGESGGIWQNVRNSECFSRDEGKTYYILSEVKDEDDLYPMHTSVSYKDGMNGDENG